MLQPPTKIDHVQYLERALWEKVDAEEREHDEGVESGTGTESGWPDKV
jgi:hypothetical protein